MERHPLHDTFVSFYNQRAPQYDTERDQFHNRLAQDLIQWAVPYVPDALKHPVKVLDLCCGTGLVSFAALDHLGQETTIHGVDISTASLAIAKEKLKAKAAPNVEFFHCSATELEGLSLQKETYSLITCCSALVLLPAAFSSILRRWSEYLRPGGVLIFDVPVANTQRVSAMMSIVVASFGVPTVDRDWIQSDSDVEKLIHDSGLKCQHVITTKTYKTRVIHVDSAEEKWEQGLNTKGLTEEQRQVGGQTFIHMMKDAADENGNITDEWKLYVGVGIKE